MSEAMMEFHWLDGKIDRGLGRGDTREQRAADALDRMGYGGGALRALDYWKQIDEEPKP